MKTKLLCVLVGVAVAVFAMDALAMCLGLVFASSLLASGGRDRS